MKSKIFLGLLSLLICININCHIVVADDSSDESYFEMEENSDGEVLLKRYLLTKDKISIDGNLEIPDVKIPVEVDYISEYAFQDCMVKDVVMSDNIKGIGNFAFYASKAWSIKISNNVKKIEERAFGRCDFKEINLPDKLVEIGPSAFCSCIYLKSITIPDKVKLIDDDAFYYCINLKKITIPDSVRYIGNRAFKDTKIENIYIPKEVESIGDEAFNRTVIIVGEKNSEAERYAKRNGNIFMTPKEKAFCDKYVNVKSISICMIIIIVIIVIIIKKIKCYKYKNNI